MITLYHPALDITKDVPESAVPVLQKSGWLTEEERAARTPSSRHHKKLDESNKEDEQHG